MPETSDRIAELRRELESNPASRQFYQLGELLRRDGRAAEAMAVLRAGLVHQPRYVAAWVSLGRACLDRTMPRDAAKALHEALELDAHNPVAWRLLGEARLAEGDRFGALDAMQHALQLAPGDEVLRAAVDSLASETWPPAAPAAPEPAPVVSPAEQAAGPAPEVAVTVAAEPAPAAVAAPPVAASTHVVTAPPVAASAALAPLVATPEPARAVAPPPPEPFGDVAPPALAAALPPVAGLFEDPFRVPPPEAVTAAAAADVFALPVEAASFMDEPFGVAAAPVPVQPPSLIDRVEPAGSMARAAAVEAWPGEAAPTLPAPAEAAIVPPFAEPEPESIGGETEPAFAAATPEAAAVVPEPATPVAAEPLVPSEELLPPPAADFESTSAFAASPVESPSGEAVAPFAVEAPPATLERYAAEPAFVPTPDEPETAGQIPAESVAPPPLDDARARAAAALRPTLTLARLHLQQQDFAAAIAILERVVVSDPENQEARDLLDLVHDMMAPLPGELPSLSARERKIAALQGWLASLTLGQERMMGR